MPKKLLYIGAWNHIQPISHFPKTREFIFIDTQPRSEFDKEHIFISCFYRHRFYKNVLRIWSQYGFSLLSSTVLDKTYDKSLVFDTHEESKPYKNNPTLLHFVNPITNQTIRYYISTNIKYNMCPQLKEDIQQSDGIILSGYFPDKVLFDYIQKPITFYCYTSTCYYHDSDKNILDVLYKSPFASTFIIMNISGQRLYTCTTIQEVNVYIKGI